MKRYVIIISLFFFVVFSISAFAEVSYTEDGTIYQYGKASIYEIGNISYEKSTILFFGGIQERESVKKTYNLLKNVDLSAFNLVCVAVYRDSADHPMDAWKTVAEGVYEYLTDRVNQGKINPDWIFIDGYSNGGAGAYYTALKVNNTQTTDLFGSSVIKIKRLTLIEGTLEGVIREKAIQELLEKNIPVFLYVSKTSDYNLSKHGRSLLKKYCTYKNFSGMLVDHGHGNRICSLVYEAPYYNHRFDSYTYYTNQHQPQNTIN